MMPFPGRTQELPWLLPELHAEAAVLRSRAWLGTLRRRTTRP